MRTAYPTPEQQNLLSEIVREDAIALELSNLENSVRRLVSKVTIQVHSDVDEILPGNLSHGLPQSPHISSDDGTVVLLSGARTIGSEMSAHLAAELKRDERKVLYIPDPFVDPPEIDSLREEFRGAATIVKNRVYVRITSKTAESETIRRALVSMLGCHSVAWLMEGELESGHPSMALVSVFDGEGWATIG